MASHNSLKKRCSIYCGYLGRLLFKNGKDEWFAWDCVGRNWVFMTERVEPLCFHTDGSGSVGAMMMMTGMLTVPFYLFHSQLSPQWFCGKDDSKIVLVVNAFTTMSYQFHDRPENA